jgi:hypothetical protein
MRGRAGANFDQLASDVHFLSAPLKFVWGMFVWAIVLLLSPLLLIATLVFGIHFMSRDEIDLVKVLLVVIGPFAFVFWWITIRHVNSRYRAKRLIAARTQTGDDYSDADLRFLEQVGKPRHIRNFVVLLTSLAGSIYCAHLFYNAGDQQFFVGVLAGIFSPAIIIAVYKLFLRFI